MITAQEVGQTNAIDVETRARQSHGISNPAIYEMVARAIAQRHSGGVLVDVGCGAGNLRSFVWGESSHGNSYCCAFQDAPGLYSAHITVLLEIDLMRIAKECGLTNINTEYSNQGRIPFTSWH